MNTKRIISVDESKKFFDTAINTLEDSLGITMFDIEKKQITFDFTSVLLLRFDNVLANKVYLYNSSLFDLALIKEFEELLSIEIHDDTEFTYQRNTETQNFTFTVKVEKVNEKLLKLYFICYEKLFDTERQLKVFSNLIGSGSSLFAGSTWWIDYDRYDNYFYQSDVGPNILGIPIDKNKLYSTEEFQKVREKSRKVSPFYDECILEEEKSFQLIRENKEDYFGGRTPVLTASGNVVWVEAYGKCLIRYPNGKQRFFVAIDIYLSDLYENSHQLEILNNLINTGLINSQVGVWYYQKHFSIGRYYFTKSHHELMGVHPHSEDDTQLKPLEILLPNITLDTQENKDILLNFKKTHNELFTKGLDKYQVVVPNYIEGNKPQWVEIRGTVVERDENGEVVLFVGVNFDITQSYLRNQELERLRKQNERLQLAEKLAIKAGNVLVWYQDDSLVNERRYMFGNDMFTKKLGVFRSPEGLLKISEVYKTIIKNNIKTSALNKKLISEFNNIYSGKTESFKHVLAEHMNPIAKEVFYFEHNVEVEDYNPDGSIKLIGGFMLDVTENILKQEQISYLANYDVLSGIHNRNYFDHFINDGLLPDSYSILLFDVDGLKLINDAFGHMQGDKIIKKLATFISEVFKDRILLARIGGDEFVVLTKDTDIDHVDSLGVKFDRMIAEDNKSSHIKLNISNGGQVVINNNISFENAFTHAENLMYRRKLNNRTSRKSKVLESILETLNAKTEETKEHSDRLKINAIKTLQGLGMNRLSELEDMELLARVHDIGKITIPDNVLFKPSELTSQEYEQIKKHSEAGYKIIRNITDSDNVSSGVLSHHENYDGSGYPQGLKGEEISIYARIISVVDTYDAITNDRIYHKKRSHEEAVSEILRCTGTQFDPKVVKVFLETCFLDKDPIKY